MKTRALLIDGIATVGFLLLAIPAASPLLADQQSSKIQQQPQAQPQGTGLSDPRGDKPAAAQKPSIPAGSGDAATDRMHGSSEGTADQRDAAPHDQNTGVFRPNDTPEQGSKQN